MTFIETLNKKNQVNYNLDQKIKSDPNKSYYLFGKAGVGKTAIALGLAKKYIEVNKISQDYEENHVRFARLIDITSTAQNSFGSSEDAWQARRRLEAYKEIDLLIIDDIGVEKNSEFIDQIIYDIIDTRYGNELTTYFTSNESLKSLSEKYHARIASRISEMCDYGKNVRGITGKDKRTGEF